MPYVPTIVFGNAALKFYLKELDTNQILNTIRRITSWKFTKISERFKVYGATDVKDISLLSNIQSPLPLDVIITFTVKGTIWTLN